jgi:hypothetical protein
MASTADGESSWRFWWNPPAASMETNAHRSSMVDTSIPAGLANAGGALHQPVAGGSNSRNAPVSGSGV